MRIGGERAEFKDVRRFTLRCWRDSRESTRGTKGGRKEGRKVLRRNAAGGARKATRTRGGWAGAGVFCLSNIKELVANFLPSSLRIPPAHPGSYETVFHLRAYTRRAFQPGVLEFRAIVYGTEEWRTVVSGNGRRRR